MAYTLPIPASGKTLREALLWEEAFFLTVGEATSGWYWEGYWSQLPNCPDDLRLATPRDFLRAYGICAEALEPSRMYSIVATLQYNAEAESYEVRSLDRGNDETKIEIALCDGDRLKVRREG